MKCFNRNEKIRNTKKRKGEFKMYQSRSLTEQQKGVLEDLFFSTLTVQEVLEKRNIARYEYCKW